MLSRSALARSGQANQAVGVSCLADEGAMRRDDELHVREVGFEPRTDLPLPRNVQVSIDFVDESDARLLDRKTPATLIARRNERQITIGVVDVAGDVQN